MIPENYIQRVIQLARQGYAAIDFRTYDTDWDSEAYLTVAGQNSNNSVRVTNDFLERGRDRRRLAADPPHRRQGRPRPCRRASCGTRSRTPPGPGPIPGCSSTRRSTTGTPARRAAGSTPRTRARSTCSSTTRRATSRRSTCWRSAEADGSFDVDDFRACRAAVDDRARDLGADGAVPVEGDRRGSATTTARSASATPISAAC